MFRGVADQIFPCTARTAARSWSAAGKRKPSERRFPKATDLSHNRSKAVSPPPHSKTQPHSRWPLHFIALMHVQFLAVDLPAGSWFVTSSLFAARYRLNDDSEKGEDGHRFPESGSRKERELMSALILCALIGSGVGAVLGRFGNCSAGNCPLLANWRRGALSGALVGVMFFFVTGIGGSAAMNQSTPNVKHINGAEFEAEVVRSAKPVVVDFYATWCGPCKILSPRLDTLAGSFTNEIKFVKINVDEAPDLSQRFNIQGIPTLLFFKNGKIVDGVVGLLSTDDLKAHLEALAGMNPPPGGAQNQ